jgi:hypothetical protein
MASHGFSSPHMPSSVCVCESSEGAGEDISQSSRRDSSLTAAAAAAAMMARKYILPSHPYLSALTTGSWKINTACKDSWQPRVHRCIHLDDPIPTSDRCQTAEHETTRHTIVRFAGVGRILVHDDLLPDLCLRGAEMAVEPETSCASLSSSHESVTSISQMQVPIRQIHQPPASQFICKPISIDNHQFR